MVGWWSHSTLAKHYCFMHNMHNPICISMVRLWSLVSGLRYCFIEREEEREKKLLSWSETRMIRIWTAIFVWNSENSKISNYNSTKEIKQVRFLHSLKFDCGLHMVVWYHKGKSIKKPSFADWSVVCIRLFIFDIRKSFTCSIFIYVYRYVWTD